MRLGNLLTMGIPELACRGQQEASKWLERVGLTGGRNGHPDAVLRNIAAGSAPDGFEARLRQRDLAGASELLLDRFRRAGPDRFFEGAVNMETSSLVAEHMPEARAQAIAAAEAVSRGCFDVLGHHALSFGEPVDWHLDPISGRRAPLVHWSCLNHLNPAAVGDSKVVWELNRHQWLVHLGQAYRLMGDERYAETFVRYIREWMQANPPGFGINWASSLEVALRLMSWCWSLFLFRRAKALCPELFLRMLEGICTHATHVEKYLSYYFAPNTHLTGEALGLFYVGIVFPELRLATHWRELGQRILMHEIQRQILPDGVHFEQSTCYQRYTTETYLHFLILSRQNGVALSASVGEQIQRMCDVLLAIRRPDGSSPEIGDADGGSLLPLAKRAPDDPRGIFSTAAAVFGRSDYAWAAGGLAPETLWLLGPPGLKAFEAIRPTPPATPPSRLFTSGGYVVMRSQWEADAHQLIFDVGPLGSPVSAGHGHADLLSIQCAAFGEPYLVDPGTFCYTADPLWRNFFRSTRAHSTLTVDGRDQALPAGPFAWEAQPRAQLRRWLSTETFDVAEAEHDAYRDLPGPVVHRRRVLFVKPRYWVVVDELEGAGEHRAELRFQFAPLTVMLDATLWVRALGAGGHALLIRAFATVPLEANIIEGKLAPIQGWISSDYARRRPAPVLVYTTVTRLPVRIVTLLFPVADPGAGPPAVSPLPSDGTGPVGLTFGGGREKILVDRSAIVLERLAG